MSWMTSPPVLLLRTLGRRLGLNSYIARVIHGDGYEARYDEAFRQTIKPGDRVWDVGANVGFYTRQFAERIGRQGCVYAFEPSPINHARLREACSDLPNVQIFNFALGAVDGVGAFQQGTDALGATSRVVNGSGDVEQEIVRIHAADTLITNGSVMTPNAIKIDVEGFEPEVLAGLQQTLGDSQLRLIGIEMHFGILRERGLSGAPRSIEELLGQQGFSIRWPDSSHILAVRS